ncbi:hypothetical protein [Marisediminicola senii]|uniref:hypothetical protein n=1 Tax=Marisediminicola senii TaxID=2711233 RepID=UPI0013E99FF4|nr:hypothetical protein [Marisediminicola senii]
MTDTYWIPANQIHTEIGNIILVPRMGFPASRRPREDLRFTIATVTNNPERRTIIVAVEERHDLTLSFAPTERVFIERKPATAEAPTSVPTLPSGSPTSTIIPDSYPRDQVDVGYWVDLQNGAGLISLTVRDGDYSSSTGLTPTEARHIAEALAAHALDIETAQ